jgi:putative nucleotidyltransferase with HDIG domain
VFRARVVDVAPESLTIEITGAEDKIDGLLEVLRRTELLEMVRTGHVWPCGAGVDVGAVHVSGAPQSDSGDVQRVRWVDLDGAGVCGVSPSPGNLLVGSSPVLLGVAATVYFIANAGSIAMVISLTERRPLMRILVDCYFWSFPYYLVGAGIAGAVGWLNQSFNWETSLLMVPVVYLIYRSYRLYLGKLEDEKRHVEEMANLHLRTIEALALAIEAKDHTTHEHLQRVRVYAIEVAKELGVTGPELEALHAAALLHDIGKLAVPEHIISKPGRLTPEEFEKMKIHTLVGAEILERVRFPYPVVPIVRAHHEKWDGSGYPLGLKGAEIPMGARILSAVDYLDALASDRQYRRALPLRDVMQKLAAESGKSFDPKVVDILQKRYQSLERLALAKSAQDPNGPLSTAIKIERGLEPAAGFENATVQDYAGRRRLSCPPSRQPGRRRSRCSNSARTWAHRSADETLSVFSVKLKPMVPYDAIAIYIKREDELVPEYVNGDNYRLFSSLRIPSGRDSRDGWRTTRSRSSMATLRWSRDI